VGLEWLQNHFDKFATPLRPGKTRLLLCDNHSSHDNYEFYEHCLTNNIALFFFPSHTTHILQPLDVGVFSPLDRYCSQEVNNWTASQPLHASLLKGDFLPMCERARKKGVTAHNIKAAWSKCDIHPFNKTRVTTNPHYTILFQAHPESLPPRESLRQLPHHTEAPLTEIEKLSITISTTVEEGQAQVKSLGSAAVRLQAELAIAQEGLHQTLAREKPATKSRKVLSSARYVTQADLQTARHAQEEPVPLKRKRATKKATGEPPAKRGRPRHHAKDSDSDVIGAADSDVEREVEALMERDREDQEERPPLAETSANMQRVARGQAPVCGASGRGNGATRGRGTGRGRATAS